MCYARMLENSANIGVSSLKEGQKNSANSGALF